MADEPKEQVAEGAGEGAASGEQGGKKEVPFNEHPRWKEVYGELQEFKKLGLAPGDVAARLQEAQELQLVVQDALALAQKQEAAAKREPENEQAAKALEEARHWMEKIIPGLGEHLKTIEALKAREEARNTRLERAALSETRVVMQAAGLDVSEKDLRDMSEVLADTIKSDEELLADYDSGNPRGAVREAFKRFTAKYGKMTERAAKAAAQRERETSRFLPRAHGGGPEAGSGRETKAPAKSLDEATERVKARLKGMDLGEL